MTPVRLIGSLSLILGIVTLQGLESRNPDIPPPPATRPLYSDQKLDHKESFL